MTEVPDGLSTATYLEYIGIPGATQECVQAVERLLLTSADVRSALILTSREGATADHALLLTVGEGDEIAVKSGFASGYWGEGPSGFSRILHLLDWYRVELDEVLVDAKLIERLDASALTTSDLDQVKAARRLRPQRLWDYIRDDSGRHGDANPWQRCDPYVPMAIIDDRLAVAARDFWTDPDGILMKVHRQLEELVREKACISIDEAHAGPAATFRAAFNGENPKLTWPLVSKSERSGRANLFMGALNAYRHVRAHRAISRPPHDLLCELLLFNQLFRFEAEAVPSPDVDCDDQLSNGSS